MLPESTVWLSLWKWCISLVCYLCALASSVVKIRCWIWQRNNFFPLCLKLNADAWSALGFYYKIANKSKILIVYVGYFDTEDASKDLCSSKLIYYWKPPWMLDVHIFIFAGFLCIATSVPGVNWFFHGNLMFCCPRSVCEMVNLKISLQWPTGEGL